jgi:hypothetical protein
MTNAFWILTAIAGWLGFGMAGLILYIAIMMATGRRIL